MNQSTELAGLEQARAIVKRFYPEMKPDYSGRRVQIALAAMKLTPTEAPEPLVERISDALLRTGLVESEGEARRLIKGGGARVNGQIMSEDALLVIGAATISAGTKHHAALSSITTTEDSGAAIVNGLTDEALRYIASSKDTAQCRARLAISIDDLQRDDQIISSEDSGEVEYLTITLTREGVVTAHHAFDADFDEMVQGTQAIVTALQERLAGKANCPFSRIDLEADSGEVIQADRIKRLQNDVRRLREEANMDERASASSKNPDAAPVFALWAIDKRQRADDIEALLSLRDHRIASQPSVEREVGGITEELWHGLAASFGPVLKEAFPEYSPVERMRAGEALCAEVRKREGWFNPAGSEMVVAWLRTAEALAGPGPYKSLDAPIRLSVIRNLIEAIERGDHLATGTEPSVVGDL